MKIERIELDGFGHFASYSLGPFDAPLTLLHGPNEAGKSTLLAAIRAILFGFPSRNAKDHYPPFEGGRHGGRLHVVSAAGERLVIERHQGARGGPVAISDESGTTLPEASLQALLGGHSKAVFEQVFAFTLDELTSDALLKDDEVNGQIYSAGIGAARLPDAIRAIEDQRDAIFTRRGRVHRMAQAGRALEEVQSKLREVERNAGRYAELTGQARQLKDAADETALRRETLQAELGQARQLEQAWEPWGELAETERELEQLAVADFPADGILRLDQFEEGARKAGSTAETARLRLKAARQAADAQIEHEDILELGAEISALQSGSGRFRSAVEDLPKREGERDSQQAQLNDALLALGGDWGIERLEAFSFSGADESEVGRHRLLLEDARDARRTAEARRDDAAAALRAGESQPGDAELLDQREEIARLERGRPAFADAVAGLPEARAQLQAAGRETERALGELGPDWGADRLQQLDLSIAVRGEIGEFAERMRTAEAETARLSALAAQSGDLLEESRREEASAREALDAAVQPALDAEAIGERRRTIRAAQNRLREAEAARQRIGALEGQLAAVGGPDAGGPDAAETESRRDWNRIIGGLGVLAGIAILAIGAALGGDSLVVGLVAGILLAAIGASLFSPRRPARNDADSPIARNARDSLRQAREGEAEIAAQLADAAAMLGIERIDEEALNEVEASLDRAADDLRERGDLERRLDDCETRRTEREQSSATAAEAAAEASDARAGIEREWSEWLARRGLRDDFRPDGVEQLVGAATVARQALGEQRRIHGQVARMEQAIAQFTAAVQPLAAQFGIRADDEPAALEAATAGLVERSAAAGRRSADFERATEAADASEQDLASADEREAEAANGWAAWLAERGLDPGLAPDAVLRLREQVETARARHRQLQDTERRINGINVITGEYTEAVSDLAAPFDITVNDAGPGSIDAAAERLIELHGSVSRSAQERRGALERQAEAEQVLAEAESDLDAAREELAALLDRGGALPSGDLGLRADDFRRRAAESEQRQDALERKAGLERQLRQLFGSGEWHDAAIGKLRSLDQQQIAAQCERIEVLAAQADAEFRDASEQLGTVRQQLADLGGERESSRLRMERERLIEQASGDAREWAKHQLADWLLDETRKKFEAERQPDVVRHAQEFLAAASGGRYRNVQAPLGEQQINVVEAGGAAKTPAQLSRGTREQLYLALRFGLIRELGARTEPLPVVLDEVLVNFDPARAAQAARAFHQLAETHQVLVFTCHPETVDRFKSAADAAGAPPPAVIEL